jgi:hypothetical protein
MWPKIGGPGAAWVVASGSVDTRSEDKRGCQARGGLFPRQTSDGVRTLFLFAGPGSEGERSSVIRAWAVSFADEMRPVAQMDSVSVF